MLTSPTAALDVCLALIRTIERADGLEAIHAAALTALRDGLGVTRSSILFFDDAGVMRFAAWSGLVLEPYVVVQHSEAGDGLVRDWPRAGAGVEMHESYALQWYSLAVLSVAMFVALNLKRAKR